jgi:GntR family transcriptional repressor for pyruvate dehydrogenase complex
MAPVTQSDIVPEPGVPVYRNVARAISERILRGELTVGQPLPSETRLAETLGVNRSTIREAIRVLEENGMLRRRVGGKRLFVSAPGDQEVANRLKTAMVLREISFRELWEAMYYLEPAISAVAAVQISAAEIELLEENVDRTRHAVAKSEDLAKYDFEFHSIIVNASKSRVLQLCREPISQLFYPAFLHLMNRLNVNERLIFAHQRILDGLRDGDADVAREWMLKHIVDFRRGYELASFNIDQPVLWPGD